MSTVTDTRPVGLTIDLGDPFAAVAAGDWVASETGARYLVTGSRKVQARIHTHRNRWRLRCVRLDRGCDVPADVHCWWMTWYPRKKRSR